MTRSLYLGRQDWLLPLPEGFVPECNEVAARALIVHEDKILLAHHTNTDAWFTVGGRIAIGEDMRTALSREIEEEANIEADIGDLVAFFDVLMPRQKSHKFEFIFLAQPRTAPNFVERAIIDGDPSGVVDKVRWFTKAELANVPCVFPDCVRNWSDLLESHNKAAPRRYYESSCEAGYQSAQSLNRFYISSRTVTTAPSGVLMVRNHGQDFWYGAGGRIEFGEDLLQTAVREVEEEAGIASTALGVVAVDEFFSQSAKIHQINIYTHCAAVTEALPQNWFDKGGGVAEARFFTAQELAAHPRAYPSYMAELAWPKPRQEQTVLTVESV